MGAGVPGQVLADLAAKLNGYRVLTPEDAGRQLEHSQHRVGDERGDAAAHGDLFFSASAKSRS